MDIFVEDWDHLIIDFVLFKMPSLTFDLNLVLIHLI